MSDADEPGGAAMTAPKLADTETQIQALRRQVAEQCVSIASSIDTTPAKMVPPEMRERWLQELRQATVAITLVIDRLVGGLRTDPQFGVLNLARWGDAMPRPSQVVNPDEDATPTRTISTTPDTSGGTGSAAESPMA